MNAFTDLVVKRQMEAIEASLPATIQDQIEAEVPTLTEGKVDFSAVGHQKLAAQKSSALLSFYAAAALRDTTPVKIAFLGDSIQEGDGVSDYYKRPQSLLADRLLSHWPIPGMTSQGAQWIGGWQENGTSHPAPMTLTGVTNTDFIRGSFGIPRRSLALKTTAGKWSMSAPRQMASFDVVFHRNSSGGVVNIKVDDVSIATYNTNKSSPAAYSHKEHYTVTPGMHTVSIEKDASATGASNPIVDSVIIYETADSYAKGFHVYDGAHSGYTVSDFLSGSVNISGDLTAIDPDLIVISLGANDEEASEGITPDEFYADLGTLIDMRDACPKQPGIVLMPVWKRSNTALATHQQYVAKQYQHITEDPRNCILDLNLRFPDINDSTPSSFPLIYRGLYYDGVHPSNAGAALLADTLARFLAPPA
jgi:lysophospholipase L1-like esterase